MIEVQHAALLAIAVALAARIYFGSVIFHPRYTKVWNVARKILVPVFQKILRIRGINAEIENKAYKEEYVCHVDIPPQELAQRIDEEREVEIPLLSGYKTNWKGQEEAGTFVWYHGPRPLPDLPRWLRRYQTHAFMFKDGDRGWMLCGHVEANPYRPDLWRDHFRKGESFSAMKGKNRIWAALDDIDAEQELYPP
ncbi:MAG: hypothetical protein ABEH81_01090 [Halopenitus sp.]